MAGGAGSDVSGLGGVTACVLFWRRTEKVFSVYWFADSDRAARRVSDELFRIAGEFIPAGADGEGQREEVHCHCRIAGRTRSGGEDLSAPDDGLHAIMERLRRVLSRL